MVGTKRSALANKQRAIASNESSSPGELVEEMKTSLRFVSLTLLLLLNLTPPTIQIDESTPVPQPWPERFHALLYMNLSSSNHLQITNLWYDWPKGRNVNIIQKQLGELLYDVEWNNGTSFYYTLGGGAGAGAAADRVHCEIMLFEVGIPRRNWLEGANYLGVRYTDGFMCNVWEKVDFIWYYEDVVTKIPVKWDFYDGISTHVITFEVDVMLEDSIVQAPAYCFSQNEKVYQPRMPATTRKLNSETE